MDQVATSSRQFHLLDAFADDRTAAPIIVPEGVSGLLVTRNGTRPRLKAGTPKIPSRGRRYVLEPVRHAGRPYLLIAATESTVRVNGTLS